MTEYDVAIVGAGLAGLETARRVAETDHSVAVFEAEPTVGGRVRTETREGFTIDRGFQVLFTAYPEIERALDLDSLKLQRFPPGAVVCRPNHRSVVADPLRDPRGGIETVFSGDLSLSDKVGLFTLRQSLQGRSREQIFGGRDRTIEAFLRDRGFSARFLENFARPFYGGITLDRSLLTSARVFEFTFRMLALGHAAVPETGMAAIPRQLADRALEAGVRIETSSPVVSVDGADPVTVSLGDESVTAETAVVATDPIESARLTDCSSIPTDGRPVRTQYLTLPAGNPIGEKPRIHLNAASEVPNQVVSLSAVASSYAPDGSVLLAASTPGGIKQDPAVTFEKTRSTLASWYPEAAFETLELFETVDVPFAQFVQPPGIHERLPDVRCPGGPVFLAGEVTSDSSINGALRSGRHAAAAVLEFIE
ncbi:MAG: NAD(P)/FAD-dependent oxidoreductase [Halodesulfurarchaeum sp.]